MSKPLAEFHPEKTQATMRAHDSGTRTSSRVRKKTDALATLASADLLITDE